MMGALATHAEFRDGARGGTEARLTFACDALWTRTVGGSLPIFRPEQRCADLVGDAVVPSCPIPFLPAMMGRLATLVAASARFSLDRLSDLRLVTDAICAQARIAALGERIGFALAGAVRRLELAVGPLRRGTGDRLLQADWLSSPSLVPLRLADELTVEPVSRYEIMRIVMTDRSPRWGRA
jgi:hypothetical protein